MADIITPSTLSGFMELLPGEQVIFNKIQFSGIENTALRNPEAFPRIANTVTAFAPTGQNRTRYSRNTTLTQFPGMDLRQGMQDPVKQEVIR